jgi:outer membrane protein assembly factor BamB
LAQTKLVVSDKYWDGGHVGACIADVDADGVPDVVGFLNNNMMVAIGAVSGKIIWQTQTTDAPGAGGGLLCNGGGGIVGIGARGFTIRGIDPRTGVVRWTARLPDRLRSLSVSDRCLAATAIDDSITKLGLETGNPAPCLSPTATWEYGPDIKPAVLSAAGIQISFSKVAKGSPRIVVRGSKDTTILWEQTLWISAGHYVPPYTLSASGLLVAGTTTDLEGLGVVLLNPATGKVLVSLKIAQPRPVYAVQDIKLLATAWHVFLQTSGKLYALRLPELDMLWETGN